MEIIGLIQEKQAGATGVTKAGIPWSRFVFIVNGKKYSCFEKKYFDKFNIGDNVKITGDIKDNYFNMKSMELADEKPEVVKVPKETKVSNGNGSMYASYAKDIFCAIVDPNRFAKEGVNFNEAMDKAIELVKQAKEAFE